MSHDKHLSILTALENNLPAKPALPSAPAVMTPAPEKEELVSDSEEDYKFARNKLKTLIQKAEESLDRLIIVADEAEHPRAFEVLTGMLQTTSDMTDKLMELQKKRKELIIGKKAEDAPTSQQPATNVAVFVGTTADLQKQLASTTSNSNTTIIDATCN
jgi:hypothetical protein